MIFSEKRALWSWQKARASIASRWCWLQVQMQELEYKIRQHNDLHRQVSYIFIKGYFNVFMESEFCEILLFSLFRELILILILPEFKTLIYYFLKTVSQMIYMSNFSIFNSDV